MLKYAIMVNETVLHQHRLIVECENEEDAENLADMLDDEEFNHPDDVSSSAKEYGARVVEMQEDCFVHVDDIEIDDVEEVEG